MIDTRLTFIKSMIENRINFRKIEIPENLYNFVLESKLSITVMSKLLEVGNVLFKDEEDLSNVIWSKLYEDIEEYLENV